MKIVPSLLLIVIMSFLTLMARQLDNGQAISVMIIGLLVMGAWLTGRIFARIKLPRISGYLLFGLIVGPSCWSLIPKDGFPEWIINTMPLVSRTQLDGLVFIKDLAISLIAITAGGEIKIEWLRKQLGTILILTFTAILIVWLLLSSSIFALQHFTSLAFLPEASEYGILIPILFLGLIGAGNSPSVAIAMITECKADGPLSKTLLAVTVCKDLLLVILFATMMAVSKGLLDSNTSLSGSFLLAVGAQLGGSILVGVLLGLVMAWFVSHVKDHLVFFIVGACFLFALLSEQYFYVAGHKIHLEVLLLAIAAGMTLQNLTPQISAPLFHTIEEMSLPIYCMFFAVAGAELNLSVFTSLNAAIAIFIVVGLRAFFIWSTMTATAKFLKLDEKWRNKLWLTFTPQAGITLALAVLLLSSFKDADGNSPLWATELHTLLLGLVAIHALCGPILTRLALVWSGEAGKAEGKGAAHH